MRRESVKARVTKRGLLIPKDMLAGAEEVEIRKEDHRIVISPIGQADPIFKLGKHPVKCGVSDGSERHDKYLYSGGS
jgi:virulence-associated protein VagC